MGRLAQSLLVIAALSIPAFSQTKDLPMIPHRGVDGQMEEMVHTDRVRDISGLHDDQILMEILEVQDVEQNKANAATGIKLRKHPCNFQNHRQSCWK